MESESSHPSSRERTRYLNIVYFIESARSHTIRINLDHARWAVGAAVLVFTWAIASIFWITSLRSQISATRDRLETSLTTIFDYQIKNDQVFDRAYPSDATNGYYSESAQLASNNPIADKAPDKSPAIQQVEKTADKITEKTPEKAPEKPVEKIAEKPSEKAPQKANSTAAVTSALEHGAEPAHTTDSQHVAAAKLIDISNAKVSKNGSKYSLVFDINNLSKQKAEGYIWTVASFTSDGGQSAMTAAPDHAKIDANTGEIVSVKSAYRFSIQRFKNKTFDFKTPAGKDWKLTALKIHFTDVEGNDADAVDIPVDQMTNPSQSGPTDTH